MTTEWRPYVGPELGPFFVTLRRECHYKAKPGKAKGCARCGLAQDHLDHLGAPPSLNDHTMDRIKFARMKEAWQRKLGLALEKAGLPRGLESVHVEVLLGFDTYRERDEGNVRWMLEKALGDTLVNGAVRTSWRKPEGAAPGTKPEKVVERVVEGGWLQGDSFWPTLRYRMGSIEGEHTPRESSATLQILPSCEIAMPAPRADRSPAPEGLF
jgi:hypothetical protein